MSMSNSGSRDRRLTSHVFNGIALIFAGVLIWTLVQHRSFEWGALFAMALSALLGNLDRVQELQVGMNGVIAKTRELSERTEQRMAELRQVAKVIASAVYSLNLASGRMGGTDAVKKSAVDQLFRSLRDIGLSEADLREITDAEYPYVCFDYVSAITAGMFPPAEMRDEWNSFWSSELRKGIGHEPTPDELQRFLERMGYLNDRTQELVDDYRFYKANRRHRDEPRWERRKEWRSQSRS